jgi:hypothetical protein
MTIYTPLREAIRVYLHKQGRSAKKSVEIWNSVSRSFETVIRPELTFSDMMSELRQMERDKILECVSSLDTRSGEKRWKLIRKI